MPVTIPVPGINGVTVAIAGADEDHVPPVLLFVTVMVLPVHTSSLPVIAAGNGFTVTTTVDKQLVGSV
jgi:hypothetical protein